MRKIVKNLSDIDNSLADMRTQVLLTGNAQPSASDQVISVCIFCGPRPLSTCTQAKFSSNLIYQHFVKTEAMSCSTRPNSFK